MLIQYNMAVEMIVYSLSLRQRWVLVATELSARLGQGQDASIHLNESSISVSRSLEN